MSEIRFQATGKKGEKKAAMQVWTPPGWTPMEPTNARPFQGVAVRATDTSTTPGRGTRVLSMSIGPAPHYTARTPRGPGPGTTSADFTTATIGSWLAANGGVNKLGALKPGTAIVFEVVFDEDCDWTAEVSE